MPHKRERRGQRKSSLGRSRQAEIRRGFRKAQPRKKAPEVLAVLRNEDRREGRDFAKEGLAVKTLRTRDALTAPFEEKGVEPEKTIYGYVKRSP